MLRAFTLINSYKDNAESDSAMLKFQFHQSVKPKIVNENGFS